ncbi:MAG: hypothetical protein ACRCYK_07525 [Aeromonas hydrophila]
MTYPGPKQKKRGVGCKEYTRCTVHTPLKRKSNKHLRAILVGSLGVLLASGPAWSDITYDCRVFDEEVRSREVNYNPAYGTGAMALRTFFFDPDISHKLPIYAPDPSLPAYLSQFITERLADMEIRTDCSVIRPRFGLHTATITHRVGDRAVIRAGSTDNGLITTPNINVFSATDIGLGWRHGIVMEGGTCTSSLIFYGGTTAITTPAQYRPHLPLFEGSISRESIIEGDQIGSRVIVTPHPVRWRQGATQTLRFTCTARAQSLTLEAPSTVEFGRVSIRSGMSSIASRPLVIRGSFPAQTTVTISVPEGAAAKGAHISIKYEDTPVTGPFTHAFDVPLQLTVYLDGGGAEPGELSVPLVVAVTVH